MLYSVETLLTIAHAPDAQLHKRRLADITRTMIQISLQSLPKDSPENRDWRGQLIAKIARADKNFNPNTHKICSAHFTQDCLLFHGKLTHEIHLCNVVCVNVCLCQCVFVCIPELAHSLG